MGKKENLSIFKRKIQERVKCAEEPFKGTLGTRKRGIPTSSVEDSNQTSEQEMEAVEKESTSFGKKLREAVERRDKPFCGSLGKFYK